MAPLKKDCFMTTKEMPNDKIIDTPIFNGVNP